MNRIAKIYLSYPNIFYFSDFNYLKNINDIIFTLEKFGYKNYDIIETPLDFDHYEKIFQ